MKRGSLPGMWLSLWMLWLGCAGASASGPRFVTGPPFFPGPQSLPIGWKQTNLLYSTDPGNLSTAVPHATADALVAAAAGVWNLPVASITLGQGGQLAEHVSGANVYLDTGGMMYPADVMSSNAAAVPIAVIYDTDGSVTDTLLGAGASAPLSCNSNAVTSTVDSFDPAGYILHAIIILNGRCTGPAAAQQLQMQYKLERAFGRVLGLAWSQNNDNVFTGSPTPTYNQALHWPILHPVDILCGPYSYQCLPEPFTLRADDVASMVAVYPIARNATPGAGKQASLTAANGAYGTITFPDGQGMAGVNVLVKRQEQNLPLDAWDEVSAVTGMQFRRADVSPFVAAGSDASASMGTSSQQFPGKYTMAYIPLDAGKDFDNLTVFTEPVNPLYTGALSLGPYGLNAVAPSGSAPTPLTYLGLPAPYKVELDFPIVDAASRCGTGLDGVAADPAQISAGGWWNATLCGYGHASYFGVDVKPGRTFTVEATALDADGLATTSKAMPVIGLFAPTDQAGSLPSLGVTAAAFQGLAYGTTVLHAATGSWSRVTLGVADERGDGRPDFTYQGRMFYADTVEPAQVADTGGTITITGMGFRAGNAVLVNGVAATATRWSANSIVATVPTMTAAAAANGTAVDVEVLDRGTGATSIMAGALTYSGAASLPNAMILLSAPGGTLPVGLAAAVPLAVRVVRQDGVTPVVGDKIVFSVPSGSASFGACGVNSCSVLTDAMGNATTAVTPLAAGAITLQAADGTLLQTAGFTAQSQPGSMTVQLAPQGSFPVGVSITTPLVVRVFKQDGVTAMAEQQVSFTVPVGSAVYNQCNEPVCTCITDVYGACVLYLTPTGTGPVTLQATAGPLSRQTSFTATQGIDTMVLAAAPNPTTYLGTSPGLFVIQLLKPDGVTGDYGQLVTFTVSAGASLANCPNGACQLFTDGGGKAGGGVNAGSSGTFTLKARYGALTQSTTFSVTARTYTLNVLSAPSGKVLVGTASSSPFTVQLMGADGVTPMAGYNVTVEAPLGQATLNACARSICTLTTDGNGIVSTTVTPQVPGSIPLNAVYSPAVASATITAVAAVDSLTVLSQPGGATIYPDDAVGFRVQLLKPDGATPDVGKSVTFAVTNGAFSLSGCASAPCAVITDAQGMASITGSAGSAGAVTVTASYGSLSRDMSFVVSPRNNVLQVISAPASGSPVGLAASLPFSIRVLGPDGITPLAKESVTVSVTNGSAGLADCNGLGACTFETDASGLVSTPVTPLAAGSITLRASDGNASQSVTFSAVSLPDTLRLVSAPASGAFVGSVASIPFAVQVLLGTGNAAAGKNVTVSVASGSAELQACAGASMCALTADANGMVSTQVMPLGAGLITLSAMDASVSQTASFTAVERADVLQLVSVPANGSTAGIIAVSPFTVQVLAGDGSIAVGKSVTVTVSNGLLSACQAASCTLTSDARGHVASGVVPLQAGTVGLTANEAGVSLSASFMAVAAPDVLSVVSVPPNGSLVGVDALVPFALHDVDGEGVAASRHNVTISATNAVLAACGGSTCVLTTDAGGNVTTAVTPLGAGTVNLQASEGIATASASFTAKPGPDVLQVASTPGTSVHTGSTAGTPFAVRVLSADRSTPVAGLAVTFTASGAGAVQFAACGNGACVVSTDATGLASSLVEGVTPGALSLVATADAGSGAGSASVAFQVVANDNSLNALEGATYLAEGAVVRTGLKVSALSNGVAATALPIVWTGGNGVALGQVQSSTGTDGVASADATFGPLVGAASATATACGWVTVCASFTGIGVAPAQMQIAVAQEGQQAVTGGAALAPVTVGVSDASGHPVAGAAVTIYQTASALTLGCAAQGRCPAQPVLASRVTVATSGLDGTVSVQPLVVTGTATQTNLSFAVGSAGFCTTSVTSRP